jgi:hypothetical protein
MKVNKQNVLNAPQIPQLRMKEQMILPSVQTGKQTSFIDDPTLGIVQIGKPVLLIIIPSVQPGAQISL